MATWNNERVRDLVIRTIVGEAARGDRASMVSVAHVLKNRADSGRYGDRTVSGLTNTIKAPKQFSMWNSDIASSGKTISPNDPYYQRAGAIADAVFGGDIPDNTGGADHYYTPGGMPGGRAPSWAIGQTPTATIGGQNFYKVGLGDLDATGPGHFEILNDAAHSPHWVPDPPSSSAATPSSVTSDADAGAARTYLASLSAHPTRAGDTANFNPGFATRLASAIQEARAAGVPVTVSSGFREPGQTGSAYDAGGNSSHSYGLATDIGGLDGPNGPLTAKWAAIAEKNGLHNPYGIGNAAEFNHWQLPELPLEQNPTLLAALKAAKASGDMNQVWAAYSAPDAAEGRKTVGPWLPPSQEEVNPNAPAPAAQPVAASGPPGSKNPSAGFVGPGSDKYSVVQGMTTGTSHNPQLTTAANWGNLFGGATPSAPPAATPAAPQPPAAPPGKSDAQPTTTESPPIDRNNPLPWPGPQQGPPMPTPWEKATTDRNNPMPWPEAGPGHVPNWGPWHVGGSPTNPTVDKPPALPSLSVNWGAATPNDPEDLGHGRFGNGAPAATPNAPSMGFPAQTNPFGPQQVSQLPGSMFTSAQNLIKMLFPSSTG